MRKIYQLEGQCPGAVSASMREWLLNLGGIESVAVLANLRSLDELPVVQVRTQDLDWMHPDAATSLHMNLLCAKGLRLMDIFAEETTYLPALPAA